MGSEAASVIYDLRFSIYDFIRVHRRSSFDVAQDGVCGWNPHGQRSCTILQVNSLIL
jgi:hypothetical protein